MKKKIIFTVFTLLLAGAIGFAATPFLQDTKAAYRKCDNNHKVTNVQVVKKAMDVSASTPPFTCPIPECSNKQEHNHTECPVSGCTQMTNHSHDDTVYYGHRENDGHNHNSENGGRHRRHGQGKGHHN